MTLLAAATAVDVTPAPGHRLGGYVARSGVADGTAEPLFATLTWLGTPADQGVLWLSVDAIAVTTSCAADLAAAAGKAAGIDPDRVLVCASHTHSGPIGWTGGIHPVNPAEFDSALRDRLVAAVAGAELVQAPAEVSWSAAPVPDVGTNRHRVDGPHDSTAGILAIRSAQAGTGAVLFDFACHPTVLGPDNLSWSPDWPGAARTAIAGALGNETVVGFLQGAAGDASPRFTRQGRDHAEVTRLGGLFADPVVRALRRSGSLQLSGVPKISRATVRLPVRELPPAAAVRTIVARAEAEVRGSGPALRLAQTRAEGARGQAAMMTAKLPASFDLPVSVVTLGELAWVHLPVELFASLAADIVARSPFPVTRVIGYTDGYFSYLVDQTASEAGVYEALISYFDDAATSRLIDTVVDLLHTVS